jgi:hypothetical protein
MEKFNYVIARKSSKDHGQLNPYHFYKTVVFYGDLNDAKKTLKFVRSEELKFGEDYEIYRIDNQEIIE